MNGHSRIRWIVAALIGIGAILPLAGYWLLSDRLPDVAQDVPFRESPLLDQWAAVITGFAVKPAYTLLSLLLVIVLWRQTAPDLAALRWAMLSFFVGENFCAANYLIYTDGSALFEYLHSVGMVMCFGFTVFAVLEGIDRRLIKFSDPTGGCAAVGLCGRCIKHADVPCGLKRVFRLAIPALMVLALAPMTAHLLPVSYNTQILGTWYHQSHPIVYQVFETRYCPAFAFVMLAVSWAVLVFKKKAPVAWSKVFFAAGLGAMGFSYFRLLFFHAYRENLAWFGAWEELTELIFVIAAATVLWIFHNALFLRSRGV